MRAEILPLFHFAESYRDSDQYYLTGFLCPDPFAVLEFSPRKVVIAVSDMEAGRAVKETKGATIIPFSQYRRKRQTIPQMVAGFLRDHDIENVGVLPTFPVGLARSLEADGIALEVDPDALKSRRRKKTKQEIRAIKAVQKQTERAMGMARSLLAGCQTSGGILQWEGRPLTAEKLRSLIEVFFLEKGFECVDSIVAPGRGGADPHWRGSGPIRVGIPIVIDLFPRDRMNRYHSDMSRTFVVGKASEPVREMHKTVIEAQDIAMDRLRPGVRLAQVHRAVCDVFVKRGFGVPVVGKGLPRRGFLHGTGHGLGLDIHEAPTVSDGQDVFSPGDVITVEPGLYDRRIGGIRIEDVVALTPDGEVENLTRFDRELEII
jgi:Xaa-Pro aminopeptidase